MRDAGLPGGPCRHPPRVVDTRHDRHKCTAGHAVVSKAIRKVSDTQPSYGGSDQRDTVVGFEASLRTNRNNLVAIHKLPGFRFRQHGCEMSRAKRERPTQT